MAIYLGIDIGTTSTKCLAVDENGNVLAVTRYAYPLNHRHESWAEQDPEDYWRALTETIQQCVHICSEKSYAASDIKSIAMSTQGDTLILADEAGNPLYPAVSWMDSRGSSECSELISQTGQSFWYKNTGQALAPYASICAIRWLQKNEPGVLNEARISFVPDFLAKRLCGKWVIDSPSASWTPLYSPYTRSWSSDVLLLLDIPSDSLSETVESGNTIGKILPEVAGDLGLSEGVEIISGAFDQAAAGHGSGGGRDRRAVLSCGTAWVLYAVSNVPVVDSNEKAPVCCHVSEDEWGVVLPFSGGTTYDWLKKTFAQGEAKDATSADSLMFIPHLYGEISPGWREYSRGNLLGLTLSHTSSDIELALMRGLAFETRRNMEAARGIGVTFDMVRMVGGATKSEVWPNIIANVLGLPVEVSDFSESACFGAAKLAAGDISDQWNDGNLRLLEPDVDQAKKMDRLYERYLKCLEALIVL